MCFCSGVGWGLGKGWCWTMCMTKGVNQVHKMRVHLSAMGSEEELTP